MDKDRFLVWDLPKEKDLYNFTHISDHDLDREVTLIKRLMPEAG